MRKVPIFLKDIHFFSFCFNFVSKLFEISTGNFLSATTLIQGNKVHGNPLEANQ